MSGFFSKLLGGVASIATGGMAGPLIGAAASLIGGSQDRKAQQAANLANSPVEQRKQFEKAGINPIVGMSNGMYIPQVAASMGDSFANAGAQISSGLDTLHDRELAETALENENETLRENLAELMARPQGRSAMQSTGVSIPSVNRPNVVPLMNNPRFANSAGAFTLAPEFGAATPEVVISGDENGDLRYQGTKRTYTDIDGNTIERRRNPVSILEEEDGEVVSNLESVIRTAPYVIDKVQGVGSDILWRFPYWGGRDQMRQRNAEADRAAGYNMPPTRIERLNGVFDQLGQGVSFGGLQLQ